MALKNRTSSTTGTFDKIQRLLAENGATKVMFDYTRDGSGTLEAISFALDINGKSAGFRLPAMVENVFQILYPNHNEYRYKRFVKGWREQAYKTAWANIRDWIDAQLALVQTRQVEMAQVFLPYLIMQGGQTLYEKTITNPEFLLGSGE